MCIYEKNTYPFELQNIKDSEKKKNMSSETENAYLVEIIGPEETAEFPNVGGM